MTADDEHQIGYKALPRGVPVFTSDGTELGHIDVPDRPLQILFGGPDRRTLFILTHHALYAARI